MGRKIAAAAYREVRRTAPPRPVHWSGLIVSAYSDRSILLVAGLTAMGMVAVVYALVVPMPPPVRVVALIVAVLLTIWFLGLPVLNARHYASVVRRGVVGSAVVRSVTYLRPREVVGKSVEAMRNGVAYGELELEGTSTPLHFESDESWARDLRPGSRLTAVTDPDRREILMLVRDD
jgi:hypothetical protein